MTTPPLRALALCISVLSLGGCGDDGGSPPTDAGIDADALDGGDTSAVYAIVTQVFGTSSATSYIALTNSLTEARTLSLDDATEVAGRALGAGIAGSGTLFVGSGEAGTLTRYDLSADGTRLVEGDALSFAGRGVTAISEYQEQLQFVSETKAYYLDGRTAQLIVWNPSEMTVVGSVSLEALVIDDAYLTFSTNALRDGESIYFPLGWRSTDALRVVSLAGVLVIDTSDDSISLLTDDRCGYVRTAALGGDGRIYLATEAWGSAVHRINPDNAPDPCMLRLNEDRSGFDPGFYVPLNELVEEDAVGSLMPGPDGNGWLRVLDETLTIVEVSTNARVLASTVAWRWASVPLGDEIHSATINPDLEVGIGSEFYIDLGDERAIPLFNGRSDTSLRDFSTGTPAVATVHVDGMVFSAVKLR